MDMTLTTPALLFSAISLLLLAYTNRFHVLAGLIRTLNQAYQEKKQEKHLMAQIRNLEIRLKAIQWMQGFGVLSFFSCVLSMFCLFAGNVQSGETVFGAALIFLLISLAISLVEVSLSAGALKIQLRECCIQDSPDQKK